MAAPRIDAPRPRLAAAALVFVAAVAVFAVIAFNVAQGHRLTAVDDAVALWLHRRATPTVTAWMTAVTTLHSTVAVSCWAAAVALYQGWRRHWRRVAMIAASVGGVLALNVAMKLTIQRDRPVFDDPLLTLATYSFPSGHVAGSTALYGLFVAWVFVRTPALHWRSLAVLVAVAMVAVVALTRLYLGVHFLSDAAGAVAEAVAWLALCFAVLAPNR